MGVYTVVADRNQKILLNLIVGVIIAVTVLMPFASIASAAQLAERSITLSSSATGATDVTYDIQFEAIADAGAVVIEFCDGSVAGAQIVGQACTTPTNLDFGTLSVGASSPTFTAPAELASGRAVALTGTVDVTSTPVPVSIELSGITNPDAGTMYARIVTYTDRTSADSYTSTVLGAGSVDQGTVGVAITDTIGVQGAILETMIFCVSGAVIAEGCVDPTAPSVNLGTQVGTSGIYALDLEAINTGNVYTQITTNAAKGAVVRLKSSTAGCGGLIRENISTDCFIAPALDTDVTTADAMFGVKTATATGTGTSGVLKPATGSIYNHTAYKMNFVALDASGVTSTYGDPFLDTDEGPANNMNMTLNFAASATNETPAGRYSANLSMIATGTF